MSTEELKYFLKYMLRQYVLEIKQVIKGFTNLARPKLWMFVFSAILIYQIAVGHKTEIFITLVILIFIWLWDSWEAGHWKAEFRKEYYDKLREKAKDSFPPPPPPNFKDEQKRK